VTHFFDFLLEINALLFGLLLHRLNLIAGLVPIFISVVRLLNNVGHFFSFLMQFTFEFFVKVVKDDPFFSERVDDVFEVFVDGDGLIVLLIGLVESIFEDFDLFLEIGFVLCAGVDASTVLLFFNDFFLEVGNMNVDVILNLYFFLNDGCDFGKKLFHALNGVMIGVGRLFIIDFGLSKRIKLR
jgi:hypothetical protein